MPAKEVPRDTPTRPPGPPAPPVALADSSCAEVASPCIGVLWFANFTPYLPVISAAKTSFPLATFAALW